jgi:Beta-propeller repeat
VKRWSALAVASLGLASCEIYVSIGTWEHVAASTASSTGDAPLCMPGAMRPCYDGPPGTEGVGTCKAGAQTCAGDGASWSQCVGDVLPQPPNCAIGKDLHCDGAVPVCKGNLLWAKRFGDASNQVGGSVASDPAGDVIISGEFWGSVDFGGGTPLVSEGASVNSDAYVAKLDGADGSYLWANGYVAAAGADTAGVIVDRIAVGASSGNVWVTGSFSGTVDFGAGPVTGTDEGGDVFVLELNAGGGYVWSKNFALGTSTPHNGVSGIVVDAADEVLIGGGFSGLADFGGGPVMSTGGQDVFLVEYDAAGTYLWSEHFGIPGDNESLTLDDLAVNAAGQVIAVGAFEGGPLDFGSGAPFTSVGQRDAFVLKLDPSGTPIWSKQFGAPGADVEALGIAVDASGNLLVTGPFTSPVDFGCGLLPCSSSGDSFLVQFDATGGCNWNEHIGAGPSSNVAYALAVAVDSTDSVLLAGQFSGAVKFGGPPLQSTGGRDAFLAKQAPWGDTLWAQGYGDPSSQTNASTAGGVAADPSSNVLVTGAFSGSIDFGSSTLTSAGGSDIFVAKFGP